MAVDKNLFSFMFSLRVCVDDFVFRWRVLELLVHEEMN